MKWVCVYAERDIAEDGTDLATAVSPHLQALQVRPCSARSRVHSLEWAVSQAVGPLMCLPGCPFQVMPGCCCVMQSVFDLARLCLTQRQCSMSRRVGRSDQT